MMTAALKCPDTKPLAGYFIETLKNKLYDLSFRARNKNVIYDYDVFQSSEDDLKNVFDHNKISLLKKNDKHVYFYENDLTILNDEEKNYLALYSQIPCTNKIAAKRMGLSESKVSRIRKRIKNKLMPAYIRNRDRQQYKVSEIISGVNNNIEGEFRAYALGDQGMDIEKAHYADSDYNTDFNIPGDDRTTKIRMNLPEK